VIEFVGDLRQVGGFLRFPPPIKLTAKIESGLGLVLCLWCLTPLSTIFQLYHGYLVLLVEYTEKTADLPQV
jgi:hypothetical protein